MKLVCSTTLNNRLLPSLAIKANKKNVKSTVALCKHPSSEKYYLILFTGQNKNGSKYDLKQNIEKVSTKFVNDGKSTIQFKNPPHDLFIQADVIQLKSFLHLLQNVVRGTVTDKDFKTCSSLNVTPVKDMAPTKLMITKRSDYPLKGFPRTLESLTITNISRLSLDIGILRLSKLRQLNLSENCISKLPEEFGKLTLQELDISSNKFNESSLKDWRWLSGNICKTLSSLNLANNALKHVPDFLIKLDTLTNLDLSKNMLEKLPNGIGRLKNLRNLNVSQNSLQGLPGTIRILKLDVIDVSNNDFNDVTSHNQLKASKNSLICTLKEYAGMNVLNHKLAYNSEMIPATLVAFLDRDANYCVCGKACFSVYYSKNIKLKPSQFAKTVVSSNNSFFIPLFCYYCSIACVSFYQRDRGILVR